eukprot:m51a1_g11189 hypothetical protein (124) ;mRNA; f:28695-29311
MSVHLRDLIATALRAGDEIRAVRASGQLDIHDKGHDDPMTRADVAAQVTVAGGLLARWPRLRLVCEEDIDHYDAPPPPAADDVTRATLVAPPAEDDVPAALRDLDPARLVVFIEKISMAPAQG